MLKRWWSDVLAASVPDSGFDVAHCAGLPEAVRRWLCYAIAPGTPLRSAVMLRQHGQILVGGWHPFVARQLLAPPAGFIWASRTRLFGLSVKGFDRYTDGVGEMCQRLPGGLRMVSATSRDVTLSSLGRMASELPWTPAYALSPNVQWQHRDRHQAAAVVKVGYVSHSVSVTVDDTGVLTNIRMARWAQLAKEPFRERVFQASLDKHRWFDGYAIPTRVVAGYDEPMQPFIKIEVDDARYY